MILSYLTTLKWKTHIKIYNLCQLHSSYLHAPADSFKKYIWITAFPLNLSFLKVSMPMLTNSLHKFCKISEEQMNTRGSIFLYQKTLFYLNTPMYQNLIKKGFPDILVIVYQWGSLLLILSQNYDDTGRSNLRTLHKQLLTKKKCICLCPFYFHLEVINIWQKEQQTKLTSEYHLTKSNTLQKPDGRAK